MCSEFNNKIVEDVMKEDMSVEATRQYGGYGYGGFVECCEGVVDPLLLLSIVTGEGEE